MDHGQLRRALLDVVGQLGSEHESYTLDDGIALFRSERVVRGLLKPRTLVAYRCGLGKLSAWRGSADLAATDWRLEAAEWYALEGQKIHRPLQLLRGVLLCSQRKGWRSDPHGLDDVLRKTEYAAREAVYDERQLAAFLGACERLDRAEGQSSTATFAGGLPSLRVRARDVLRLLALTGCRLGEICELRLDEVRPGYLRLRDSKTGPRTVPVGAQAQLVIGRQRVAHGLVFPGREPHKSINSRTVQRAFDEVRDEAGLREGTVHTLRHSVATIAVRSGVPLQVVQKILGHANASYVTQRYVHLAARDTALGIAKVELAITNGGVR